MRKVPPAPLPWVVERDQNVREPAASKNTIHPQEWLWKPKYRVWAGLREPYHSELAQRLTDRRWHFCPCMGLSEMLADLTNAEVRQAEELGKGTHRIGTVVPGDRARVDTMVACADELAVQTLRMPRAATPDRVFSHATYLVERGGKPIPVDTEAAWQVGTDVVMFL